jgi:hypothetical protein
LVVELPDKTLKTLSSGDVKIKLWILPQGFWLCGIFLCLYIFVIVHNIYIIYLIFLPKNSII